MSPAARTLHLGGRLRLPVDVVTRTAAVVGQKGTGKTSTAVVVIEEAAAAGARFAWMDPTGAAHGLRSSADGEGPGLDCVVMGGFNGDVPLDPSAGEVVARLVIDDGYSIVCDLEKMPKSDQVRFVAAFSEAAYHLCRSAVTIVYDEAPRFVPQAGGGDSDEAKDCLRAVTDVVMLGRRKGLGSILISQRPAKLHKDVLEQADLVIAHRLMGNNDRKAIAGWLEEAGDKGKEALGRIANLARGEAIVLAPEYDKAGVYRIRKKRTFDSSATPDVGSAVLDEPKARSEIDLGALEQTMGAALERAQEDDPTHLRRRIAELEERLEQDGGGADPADLEELRTIVEQREARVVELEEQVGGLASTRESARDVVDGLEAIAANALDETRALVDSFKSDDGAARSAPFGSEEVQAVAASTRPGAGDGGRGSGSNGDRRAPSSPPAGGGNAVDAGSARERPASPTSDGDGPPLKAGAKRMLEALLRSPRPLDRGELGTLADVRKGGTMSDYLSALRSRGLIEEADGISLTRRGEIETRRMLSLAAGASLPALTPEQVAAPHMGKVKAGARRMLDHLMRAHPDGFTRSELSRLADVSKGGTFSDYLSSLKVRGLAEERARRVYAGHVLYLWEER